LQLFDEAEIAGYVSGEHFVTIFEEMDGSG
jgi:hypothetical protein